MFRGLKSVNPISTNFHIHKFEDAPNTWLKETSIFRSNSYTIILLSKGSANYRIGLKDYIIQEGSLYFQSPKDLRYYNRLSEWEGYILVFTDDFFERIPALKNLILQFEGFKVASNSVIPLGGDDMAETQYIFKLLYDICYSQSRMKFKKAKSLLELLMIQSTEQYQKHHITIDQPEQNRIVKTFEEIIEQHLFDIVQHKVDRILTITEIAEKINISATYLTEVLKKITGKSPKEILSERIVLEAKSLLHSTDMTVNEIAYFLKFQDPSNFTKFFKIKAGLLPSEYRMRA
jgi:AraC family transcriptional regulator, transcriptional activator of pobA